MVPPPSAVIQPSKHTPIQSMLRRPAASAAVIACAANATSDRTCNTVSLGGRPHILPSRLNFNGSILVHIAASRNSGKFQEPAPRLAVVAGATWEESMANDPTPSTP